MKRVRRIKRLKQSGKLRRRKQSRERRIRAAQSAILKHVKEAGDLPNATGSPQATKPKFEKGVEDNEDRDPCP